MALMSPTDSMFLIGESREQPMHVGGLQVFELPMNLFERRHFYRSELS